MVHRRAELERRVLHAILILVTVVRVLARRGIDDGATAMLVWNVLALLRLGPHARIPRAIVRRGGGRRRWRVMLPAMPRATLERADVGQWRSLEPYVLEMRPWT